MPAGGALSGKGGRRSRPNAPDSITATEADDRGAAKRSAGGCRWPGAKPEPRYRGEWPREQGNCSKPVIANDERLGCSAGFA